MNGHDFPEDFDPDEELTPEEEEWIRKATDAILNADPEFPKWIEARHKEAMAAMDSDEHACCFFSHVGCSSDPQKVN